MTTTTEATDPPSRLGSRQRAAVFASAALVPLNSTMIAVALPRIADDFDITIGRTSLLVTAYLIVMLVGQPLAGRVSDAVGASRALLGGLIGFAVASVVGALAPTFPVLVMARLSQAAFGTVLSPSVQSLVRSGTTEEERGAVFGALSSVIGVGAAAGPILGGLLVGAFGWPAIFVANIPIIVVGLAALPRTAQQRGTVGRSSGPGESLRNTVFAAGFAIQALLTFGQYLLLLVPPVILDARGWSSESIGLVLTTLTLGLIVMGPIGGRVGDRLGRRVPVAAGVVACAVALAVGAAGGRDIDVGWLVFVLGLFGVGYGFAIPSVMTSALESVHESRTGTAAGVLSMSRYVGSITTSAMIAAWISDDGSGVGRTTAVTLSAALVALALSLALPARNASTGGPSRGPGGVLRRP